MSNLKFVHVMKRIETLERDISEIQTLQDEINIDRDYSVPVKISLEQQVNNLLNEKTKLMEVRIDNPPEYLLENKKVKTAYITHSALTFDMLEREYYEFLRFKRSNYSADSHVNADSIKTKSVGSESKDQKGIPSLAEKSLIKPDSTIRDEEKSFMKRREDILKNLPPLEY